MGMMGLMGELRNITWNANPFMVQKGESNNSLRTRFGQRLAFF
jgi:hypothetical protein